MTWELIKTKQYGNLILNLSENENGLTVLDIKSYHQSINLCEIEIDHLKNFLKGEI
jgi:hypothetical protein